MVCVPAAGIFAPVSKISKVVDQTPSSVTSTPRTPRLDLPSRLAAKTKKEKKEREKGEEGGAQAASGVGGLPAVGWSPDVLCAPPAQKKKTSVASLDPEGLNVEVGDQVLVAGQKHGVVRFFGKTDFAPGGFAAAQPLA